MESSSSVIRCFLRWQGNTWGESSGILRQIEVELANHKSTAQACKEAGITEQTYYRMRNEYGGLNGMVRFLDFFEFRRLFDSCWYGHQFRGRLLIRRRLLFIEYNHE